MRIPIGACLVSTQRVGHQNKIVVKSAVWPWDVVTLSPGFSARIHVSDKCTRGQYNLIKVVQDSGLSSVAVFTPESRGLRKNVVWLE